MKNKLFVGSLSWSATDEDLRDIFSPFGEIVSANVVMDRETGRSRGFGFVEYKTDEEAQAAIDALDGTEHMDRPIVVNVAKPMERR
ncbi:MAG: RNA-binding protein [bacterium]|nr:RNA-binding protein [bacterium]